MKVQDFEFSFEKLVLAGLVTVVLLGIASGQGIDTYAGNVIKAIVTGSSLSDRWVGFSGSVGSPGTLSAAPFRSEAAGDSRSGQVQDVTFEGQDDRTFFYVAIPFDDSDFNSNNLRNVSLSDVQADGLFDEQDYPNFYPDSTSYSEMSDSPVETFEEEGEVTLLNNTYQTVRTELEQGVPYHVVGYEYNGDIKPIYLSPINDYDSCYDGNDCNFQFLVPKIGNNEQYNFYQVPEGIAINVTTYIDGEKSTTFDYAGRPYRLNITTRNIFGGGGKVDRPIEITETEGNNLFMPAVNSSNYKSSAIVKTSTSNGYKEVLFSPTAYNSPNSYELSVKALNGIGKVVGSEDMTISNSKIEFTNQGPDDKDLGEYTTDYKKGVNRLTPIANCLFENINNGNYFRLTPDNNKNSYTLTRGVPYVVDIRDSTSQKYRLSEPGSHLVMSPVRSNDFGETIQMSSTGAPFDENSNVVFTPTIPKSEDGDFTLDLLDSQGSLNNEIDLNIKGSTCGTNEAGRFTAVANSNEFKKRINSVTPILNSLFVAGT